MGCAFKVKRWDMVIFVLGFERNNLLIQTLRLRKYFSIFSEFRFHIFLLHVLWPVALLCISIIDVISGQIESCAKQRNACPKFGKFAK